MMEERTRKVPKWFLLSAVFLPVFFPVYCYANVGLPMIGLTFPYMALAFIPVFLLEGIVYSKRLDLDYGTSFSASFLANLFSTLVGFPLAWLLSLAIEFLVLLPVLDPQTKGFTSYAFLTVLGPAWLGPPIGLRDYWYVAVAAFFGLIPAYFISVWMELFVVRRCFNRTDIGKVKKAVWAANFLTYGILGAVCLVLSLIAKLLYK